MSAIITTAPAHIATGAWSDPCLSTQSCRVASSLPAKPQLCCHDVLDAKMYPHLLEMIVGYAPYRSLIALRAVSRSVRDMCDALLARHLVLAPRTDLPARPSPVPVAEVPPSPQQADILDEFDDLSEVGFTVSPPAHEAVTGDFKVTIASPQGRIPLLRAWQQFTWRGAAADMDDQPICLEGGAEVATRAILSLRGTRTIDVVGAIIDPRPALLFRLLHGPIILRLRRDESGIAPQVSPDLDLPPEFDMVKLYSLAVNHVSTVVLFGDLWDPVHPSHPTPDVSHPSLTQSRQTLTRLVLNLAFDPTNLAIPPDVNDTEYPLSVKEVVIIFRATRGHRPRGSMRATREDIIRYLDILFETISFYLTDIHHTLVNVSDLNPAWVTDAAPVFQAKVDVEADICDKVAKDLALRCTEGGDSAADILDRHLRFLSIDEFRRDVGEEQFRLETVEDLGC